MTIALVAVFILPYVTYVVLYIYIVSNFKLSISIVLINYPPARRIIYAYICSIHICIL